MSTTTIRLPEELKSRIDKLAAETGKSAHGFMVDALTQAAEQLERRLAYDAEIERRWKRTLRTGAYYTHEDMRSYGLALVHGESVAPPEPRKMSAEALARLRASARRMGDA